VNYIYWLSQIQHSEQSLVGDKLFILSQLLQHECPILPGLVLGNNLFKDFLASLETSKSLDGNLCESLTSLNINDYQTLQTVAKSNRQIIIASGTAIKFR
jgi:pyruvate, water dikinase